MRVDTKRVAISELKKFAAMCLRTLGLHDSDVDVATDGILQSDVRGFTTHGIKNLFRIYAPELERGIIRPKAEPRCLSDAPGSAVLDGNHGIGFVVGTMAMEQAIEKARRCGVGVVAVRNSTHFGSASFYTLLAAKKGCIGFASSNLGSQVIAPAPGGAKRLVGTNPFSIAAPAGGMPDFCLDMSTTVASTGQIKRAYELGKLIPEGWLRAFDGSWTTDPGAFLRAEADLALLGGARETGGFKGFGLALLVDILSGILSGGVVGPRPELSSVATSSSTPPGNDICHTFAAIDISKFRPVDEFQNAMDEMLSAVCSSPSREEGEIAYPGFHEARREEHSRRDGIEIDPVLWGEMEVWGNKLKLDMPSEKPVIRQSGENETSNDRVANEVRV